MVDEETPSPDATVIHAEHLKRMRSAFHVVLDDRQQYVLTRRYGLDDSEYRTLSTVGKEMGLSRERVRQIERDALQRLRDHGGLRNTGSVRVDAE